MKMDNHTSSYWQDIAQDKKVPSTRSRARWEEASDGTTPSSCGTSITNVPKTRQGHPPGQEDGLGPQPPSQARVPRRNKRDIRSSNWTIAEKVLLHCYNYSKFEGWSKSSKEMLQLRLNKTDLPQVKKKTPVGNLCSLVSQMDKYLSSEEITFIEREAVIEAEKDYSSTRAELTEQNLKNKWSIKEKWTLIWAMQYAKSKFNTQKET